MTILKEHVSFSEIKQWKECGWRHKLLYVDKIKTFEESPHLHYGTIIHDACEHYLKTKSLKVEESKKRIIQAWDEHGFDSNDFIILQSNRAKIQGWKYKHNNLNNWLIWAENSIRALPDFLENTFPGWEYVAAEESLYENIDRFNMKFKGYIDCIIRVPYKDKYKYWIIDWKTSNGRGWSIEKQRDFLLQTQLILYKHFWGTKNNIEMKNIKCGFVLLKKVKNVNKVCQLINLSSGPKSIEKSKKTMTNMISAVNKKLYLKNRNSCKFCLFYNTEHCS
tara:strand:+ start:1851 stop:2684 length:834 start_codon:yes stop_codon:yes gene_type:complete